MVVNMVVGVSMRVIVGLLVFVESFVGMEVVVLVDMTEARRLYWARLEKVFFFLFRIFLFCFMNWLFELRMAFNIVSKHITSTT